MVSHTRESQEGLQLGRNPRRPASSGLGQGLDLSIWDPSCAPEVRVPHSPASLCLPLITCEGTFLNGCKEKFERCY